MTLVSVIIPTTGRPELILRAVGSVLAQTHHDLEVIVTIEGPNAATVAKLESVADPRLRMIQNEVALGAGPARNAAAETANGEWLAFLDDDDEWLPEKLERQLAAASVDEDVLITCKCRIVTQRGSYLWPWRLYRTGEPVDDYLFDRRSFLRGEAYIGTSTMIVPTRLFRKTGFGPTPIHEDTTLLLRVTKAVGGRIVMLPDVLTVVYTERGQASLGTVFSWREALAWLDQTQSMLSRRAYSGFCLTTIVSQAVRQRDYNAFSILFGRAWREGSPTPVHVLLFLVFWLVPIEFRRQIRAWLSSIEAPASKRPTS